MRSVELTKNQQVGVLCASITIIAVALALARVVDASVASSATRVTLSWGLQETTGISWEQLQNFSGRPLSVEPS